MRILVAALACVALTRPARADEPGDAIALLPLDADKRLEIYGQPVAAELARALRGVAAEVVVVGANMAVPDRALIVVHGKIASGKAGAIELSARLTDPKSGASLGEPLAAHAESLTAIDRATADLAAKIVAVVQDRLPALRTAAHAKDGKPGPKFEPPRRPPAETQPPARLLFAVTGPANDALVAALPDALATWATAHHRATAAGSADQLAAARDLAIALDVIELRVDAGAAPMARAKVRVRVAKRGDKVEMLWDRVVVTDTIVGERGMATPALAARVAREVLAIVQPHVRRVVPTW